MAPDRQKVMIGGMTLSDGEWGKVKSKIKEVWLLKEIGPTIIFYPLPLPAVMPCCYAAVECYPVDDGIS